MKNGGCLESEGQIKVISSKDTIIKLTIKTLSETTNCAFICDKL